ncbi:STAS domain-containing protein [Micromonospora sp. WMMD980]|uniref:STAS domain-containing protein n=1 Tax=Micromonospora sp. WMMD980 TaxID=3016088 RepID=UPI00241734EB|nr:STAS domain-containing protein [Micromonospora sp. WMMD980]MDG4801240.1 STAS domain-containing protein [Micromonospora sp. WMMD980]
MDRSDPAAPVVSVGGDLAYATSTPLRAEVDRLLAERPAALVLDFDGLNFLDSTGLSVIVHAWREGQQVGTAIELRSVPRFLETILDMTGVTGLLDRPPVDGRPASGSAASA